MNRFPLVALLALAAVLPAARAADPAPTISNVSPSSGPIAGGTVVTITGTGFVTPMSVTFGGTAATTVTIDSPTQLTVTAPAHARGLVDVVVTQTTPPPTSGTAAGAYTYLAPPSRLWIPRAPGSATGGNPGGFDLCIADAANRSLEASLDLNAADPLLPTDDDWAVTQVLFDATGTWAYCATAGRPGTLDSRKVFVVKTARALGVEAGAPVVATIDTAGNPYQVALSSAGTTLFVADGGSWAASSTNLPSGTFRAYDVTDPAAPVARAGSPATVGVLPVLCYDSTAYRKWGTNSSFPGTVQSRNNRCVVTNAGSHTLSAVDLSTFGVTDTADVGASGGGPIQTAVALASPFADDFVFAESTDLLSAATVYRIYRISTGEVLDKGTVATAVPFFPLLPVPDLASRTAWPHPDGQSLVAIPATGAAVVSFNPATGGTAARATIPGTEPPTTLAYNDATRLFYARRAAGGWTVLSVADDRGAAPQAVAQIEDATGVDSIRVFGTGAELAGTTTSALAILEGNPSSANAHKIVASVALPLNPAGGPVHPQPSLPAGGARTFVTVAAPGSGTRIVVPLAGTEFCAGEPVPSFEFTGPSGGEGTFEIELGSQPDFITGPGAGRAVTRVPRGASSGTPSRRAWLHVLRAAAGDGVRPLYARVNFLPRAGIRQHGEVRAFGVCAGTAPAAVAPANGAAATPGSVPGFVFQTGGPGRYWIEFAAEDGFEEGVLARHRVEEDVAPAQVSTAVPLRLWRDAAERAARRGGEILWRVRFRDPLGRDNLSAERSLTLPGE